MKRTLILHIFITLITVGETNFERDETDYDESGIYDYGSNNYVDSKGEKRFPKVIIIGVRKCGTRALLAFCGLHPNIVFAENEMHFFNDDDNYRKGLSWYKNQMPISLPGQITMEKTPGYFINKNAPHRIKRMDPNIKLIIVVRDPIERIISDWVQVTAKRQAMGLKPIKGSLENRLLTKSGRVNKKYRAVSTSIYLRYYKEWTKHFKHSQILVVDGGELREKPWESVKKVETFLKLPNFVKENEFYFNQTRGFYCMKHGKGNGKPKCLNDSKGRVHPKVKPDVLRKLKRFYKLYNRLFFRQIGHTFPWNRQQE